MDLTINVLQPQANARIPQLLIICCFLLSVFSQQNSQESLFCPIVEELFSRKWEIVSYSAVIITTMNLSF